MLSRDIKNLNAQIALNKRSNRYIESKIKSISSLIYDEKVWGEYLHSISTDAKRYDIKILDFKNRYTDNNNSFSRILDITLKTTGSYKDTLRFINSLEQNDLVVDIHTLAIKAKKKINTELIISVWGIRYL